VGWTTWEEINVGRGKNFGWPYFEGNFRTRDYQNLPTANAFYNSGTAITNPAYTTVHNNSASAIVVGDFYRGGDAQWQGGLFVTDYSIGTVDVVFFNAAGTEVVNTKRFANNVFSAVQILSGPDNNMYFSNIVTGQIERWRFA
jgi:glucose/arabinose dehydrogenase